MWFRQVTCDNCFNLLGKISVYNCYVILGIEKSKIIKSDTSFESYMPYTNDYPINFAAYNNRNPSGDLFIYRPNEENLDFQQRTFFCGNQCAHEFSQRSNIVGFYFDKTFNSVRGISPHMVVINRKLGGDDYRGLFFAWQDEWVINFSEEDKSKYNQITIFPRIRTERLVLREFKETESDQLLNILKEKDFIKFYDGHVNENQYYNDLTHTYIKNQFKYWKKNYNRRTGIEWAIVNNLNNEIIGFIKVHKNGKIDTTHWYVEFAIISTQRNKGFMKEVLSSTLRWCKLNGLDELRAMVEIYNVPCIKLLDGFTKTKNLFQAKNYNNNLRQILGYIIKL